MKEIVSIYKQVIQKIQEAYLLYNEDRNGNGTYKEWLWLQESAVFGNDMPLGKEQELKED